MLDGWIILLAAFCYLCLLFAIAYYGDKRADEGRSIISNPYVYSLSLAVYCSAWTFWGNIGKVTESGVSYLPVYLGPTLMASLWWIVLRKIIRISKTQRLTSIADFISSRYGKSTLLGGLVTIVAVAGIIPYISLQLKAISNSFLVISSFPDIHVPSFFSDMYLYRDPALYATFILIVFALLFGTRHLDATERHEGVVAAIAFESIVKLLAFIILGLFVTYSVFNGFSDIFVQAGQKMSHLFVLDTSTAVYADWVWLTLISMMAIMFLPRQFQVAVVENVNEDHLRKAIWLFPLYLLIINIFVIPIALGGITDGAGITGNPEYFGLTLPLMKDQPLIALTVFIGGLSAATGMVIVSTIALSTMICNDLIIPILLRSFLWELLEKRKIHLAPLMIRRVSMVVVLLLAYGHVHFISKKDTLVSIGLISFAAVAQFAPAILGGIFWKRGTRLGALWGLSAGFMIWAYTLVIPSLIRAGLMPEQILLQGPWGLAWLKPFQLFGFSDFNNISHAMFWSMLANLSLYFGISLLTRPTAMEFSQATLYVDVFKQTKDTYYFKTATASIFDLRSLLVRFMGEKATDEALISYARKHNLKWDKALEAKTDLVLYAEKLLAGTIGSASARVMVYSIVKQEPLSVREIMEMLDETQQVIAYSRELEQKSEALQRATAEIKEANQKLKELDRLKDDFVSTVTHELRTPLASIRAVSEILHDNPDIDKQQRFEFIAIIIKEAERLSRLINQVLDIQKFDSKLMVLHLNPMSIKAVMDDALVATKQVVEEKKIQLNLNITAGIPSIQADRDRIIQVIINLVSNAAKFCPSEEGVITISVRTDNEWLTMDIQDNGIGIETDDKELIFERFSQIKRPDVGHQSGSGLGLTICKHIIELHQGKIWVTSVPQKGSTFSFSLPLTLDKNFGTTELEQQ